ncbi:hypothetical protein GCM10007913_12050 [Devosia yakushimensis]|uniref:Uncharacterized protein n=1 Tax=Devosia yakushimensis TaxID=470028 RepID=A0ABQ5UDI2_9HYPH|nr:hypothetical protein GCM10007913_12050 [Devosia yakushimensis]
MIEAKTRPCQFGAKCLVQCPECREPRTFFGMPIITDPSVELDVVEVRVDGKTVYVFSPKPKP